MAKILLTTREAAESIGVKAATLRQNYLPKMIEGIHYFRPNSRSLRFNKEAVQHGYLNGFESEAHLIWLAKQAGGLNYVRI